MAEELNRWLSDHLYVLPIAICALYYGVWSETRRIDKRIDAVLKLMELDRRGTNPFDDD